MKTQYISAYTFILVILLGAGLASASAVDLIQLMPDSIKSINSSNGLEPYLSSDRIDYRVWGTYRLGKIGGRAAIPRLAKMYYDEPYRPPLSGLDGLGPGVKCFALTAIGNMGGPEAESTLLSISRGYGPGSDQDSINSIYTICKALGNFNSPAVIEELNRIYSDSKIDELVRTKALVGLYLIELKKSQFKSAVDTVDYLLNIVKGYYEENSHNDNSKLIPSVIESVFYSIANSSILAAFDARSEGISVNRKMEEYLNRRRQAILSRSQAR